MEKVATPTHYFDRFCITIMDDPLTFGVRDSHPTLIIVGHLSLIFHFIGI
jgi:hypothetical protein